MAPAGDWLADAEVGAAAVVDPEATIVDAPGAAANAGGAADLADELDIAAVADGAPVSFAVVGGAVDGLAGRWAGRPASATDDEVGPAALVDPEASPVDPPGAALNAGRTADLPDQTNVAIAEVAAIIFATVIGGAVDCLLPVALLPVAGLECGVCGRWCKGGEDER